MSVFSGYEIYPSHNQQYQYQLMPISPVDIYFTIINYKYLVCSGKFYGNQAQITETEYKMEDAANCR